jgi:hypothetical protein
MPKTPATVLARKWLKRNAEIVPPAIMADLLRALDARESEKLQVPSEYLAGIGRAGGKAKSEAKRRAAKDNGKKGGRTPKLDDEIAPESLRRRELRREAREAKKKVK